MSYLRSAVRYASRVATAEAPVTLYLLKYSYVADIAERRPPHRAAHLAHARQAAERGDLVLGGALQSPIDTGLIAFNTQAAAQLFQETDPYVTQGLVSDFEIRPWLVVVGSVPTV